MGQDRLASLCSSDHSQNSEASHDKAPFLFDACLAHAGPHINLRALLLTLLGTQDERFRLGICAHSYPGGWEEHTADCTWALNVSAADKDMTLPLLLLWPKQVT